MKQTPGKTKHFVHFKIELTHKSDRATHALCRCGTPLIWCTGSDCEPEINIEDAAEQAEFARALDKAREFGH